MELRHELIEGRTELPRVGAVVPYRGVHPPYIVVNGYDDEIEAATAYLRDLALNDCSPLTVRSYGYGLLRWFRLLWLLGVTWEKATEAEVAVLAGWLRTASNPQRQRTQRWRRARVGEPEDRQTDAPDRVRTQDDQPWLSVVSGFYGFHAHQGNGPVVNHVPVSPQRRRALAHRSPLEPRPVVGRARLRQKVSDRPPRSIPDRLWDELFDRMGCERDRALLEFYVSSGPRAVVRLERHVKDLVASHATPEGRQILHRYATWHLIRRLRRRSRGNDITHTQLNVVRQHLRAAVHLLDWLTDQSLTLASCRQSDLERWMTRDETQLRREAGHFVRWALTQKIARDLNFPAVKWNGPSQAMDDDARWATARRLLHDDTIRTEDRLAGLLLLLYAQWPAAIARLTTGHIEEAAVTVRIRLGDVAVALPGPVAELALKQVSARRSHAVLAQTDSPWLFPGVQPGRPISAWARAKGSASSVSGSPRPVPPRCSSSPPNCQPRSSPAPWACTSPSPSSGSEPPPATGPLTPPTSAAEPTTTRRKTPMALDDQDMNALPSDDEIVQAGWQAVRRDGRVRDELIDVAYQEPRLRQLFPWTGMGELHFSRCTEHRWTWDIPYIQPAKGGGYWVSGPLRNESVGPAATAEEAVAMVIARLPSGTGPAFVGTPEQLAAHEDAR